MFHRDIDGYEQSFTRDEVIDGQVYRVTRPQNSGKGRLRGAEFGVQKFFDFLPGPWSDFGAQFNYTWTDAENQQWLARCMEVYAAQIDRMDQGIGRILAALEQVFVNVNPAATLMLGQARGACMTALVMKELPVAEYTALQVKQSVVGQGKAPKEQVQFMVVTMLNLSGTPQADAADALAVALTHAHTSATAGRTGLAAALMRRRR